MKRYAVLMLVLWGWLAPAWGQQPVAAPSGQIVVQAEAEPYKFVPATLAVEIPEGAYLGDGGWEILGANPNQVADIRASLKELVFVGPPGKYTLTFDGIILRDVTLPDAEGNKVTFPVFIKRVKANAVCTIKGDAPQPPKPPNPPDPPTPPGGPYQVVIFYDPQLLDDLPQAQRDVLNSSLFREWLKAQGHVLREIVDPAKAPTGGDWGAWTNAVKGDPLPRIAIAPKGGGSVMDFPLPNTIEETEALLTAPPQGKAVQP